MSQEEGVRVDWRTLAEQLYAALDSLYMEALNGTVCTPPSTWDDPFFGGDGSGSLFDIDALKCSGGCQIAWRKTIRAIRAYDAAIAPRYQRPANADQDSSETDASPRSEQANDG